MITDGAINFITSQDTTKSLIETSEFYNCSNTKQSGGGLYFYRHGECVQNRICSINSNAAKYGMYCWVEISNAAQFKNKFLNSAITQSGKLNKDIIGNIHLKNGEIEINSLNISYVDIKASNLYSIRAYQSSSKVTFSTFSNSTDTWPSDNNFVYFDKSSYVLLIKSCNYLSNNLNIIISASNASVNVVNCNFVKNIGRNYYFYHSKIGYISVNDCYIDSSNFLKYGTNTVTNNAVNSFKIEIPTMTCDFEIPDSMNQIEDEDELIYLNKNKAIMKNICLFSLHIFTVLFSEVNSS